MDVYKSPARDAIQDEGVGSFDEAAAAAFLGCGPTKLSQMRRAGTAPPHYRLGNRVRYPKHLLERWMEQAVVGAVAVWPRRRPVSDDGGDA